MNIFTMLMLSGFMNTILVFYLHDIMVNPMTYVRNISFEEKNSHGWIQHNSSTNLIASTKESSIDG